MPDTALIEYARTRFDDMDMETRAAVNELIAKIGDLEARNSVLDAERVKVKEEIKQVSLLISEYYARLHAIVPTNQIPSLQIG